MAQEQVPTVTAICLVGIRHDRCQGVVRSLTGDRPCECPVCQHESAGEVTR